MLLLFAMSAGIIIVGTLLRIYGQFLTLSIRHANIALLRWLTFMYLF